MGRGAASSSDSLTRTLNSLRRAGAPVDIAPAGGTLVIFDARRLLHQVVPMVGPGQRYALTAWLWGAPENWFGGMDFSEC
jgi:hypothetical protein